MAFGGNRLIVPPANGDCLHVKCPGSPDVLSDTSIEIEKGITCSDGNIYIYIYTKLIINIEDKCIYKDIE